MVVVLFWGAIVDIRCQRTFLAAECCSSNASDKESFFCSSFLVGVTMARAA